MEITGPFTEYIHGPSASPLSLRKHLNWFVSSEKFTFKITEFGDGKYHITPTPYLLYPKMFVGKGFRSLNSAVRHCLRGILVKEKKNASL